MNSGLLGMFSVSEIRMKLLVKSWMICYEFMGFFWGGCGGRL